MQGNLDKAKKTYKLKRKKKVCKCTSIYIAMQDKGKDIQAKKKKKGQLFKIQPNEQAEELQSIIWIYDIGLQLKK